MGNNGKMSERRCAQCGQPLSRSANFCAECGTPVKAEMGAPVTSPAVSSAAASVPATSVSAGAKTLLHFGAVRPTQPDDAPPTRSGVPLHKTMIGIPQAGGAAPRVGTAGRAEPAAPGPAAPALNPKQTMLGVATPGIAPLRPGVIPDPAPLATLSATAAGAAARFPVGPEETIVPPPEPLPEIAGPPPPPSVRRRGVPLSTVALALGGLVLVSGITVAWVLRAAPPITASARSSSDGKDVLLLHCDPRSCKDGTTAAVQGVKGTFASGEAEVVLPKPLHVGANALTVRIDRPGMGRDEDVSLLVPVAYRVRADVSPMNGPRPAIVIRVEALPGSHVVVDGKPVELGPGGTGELTIDESAAARGPADESRVVAVDAAYTVAPPAGAPDGETGRARAATPARGSVSARVSVAPLRVDVPSDHAVFEDDRFVLAGRAAKGATVTIDGSPAEVSADGSFDSTVPLSALGKHTLEIRAGTSFFAPRTIELQVERVASLAAQAKEFERRETIGYDAAMADIASAVGRAMIVEGEVIESRTVGHRTVALVDDRRGCATGPCLARVIVAADTPPARGQIIQAFGAVARPYSSSPGQTVPEIEAAFVLPSKR